MSCQAIFSLYGWSFHRDMFICVYYVIMCYLLPVFWKLGDLSQLPGLLKKETHRIMSILVSTLSELYLCNVGSQSVYLRVKLAGAVALLEESNERLNMLFMNPKLTEGEACAQTPSFFFKYLLLF